MSQDYYSEINLHLVWHTKGSRPLVTPEIEPLVHRFLRKRIVDTRGAFVHEIGGVEDHIHLAVTIPPTLLISEWIGRLKGGTSHDVNDQLGRRDRVLSWQACYGIVSFGTKNLKWVQRYIRNQRQHHARDTIEDRLERITEDEE